MSLIGCVPLRRDRISSVRNLIRQCSRLLQRGISIMMFPEGTRSIDGQVHHFKYGAFLLAEKAKVPVIPIAVDGTREILGKGTKHLNFKGAMTVTILPPVYPEEFKGDTVAFAQHVEQLLISKLAQVRSDKERGTMRFVKREMHSGRKRQAS